MTNAAFVSVFTAKASPQESQTLEARKENFPLVEKVLGLEII